MVLCTVRVMCERGTNGGIRRKKKYLFLLCLANEIHFLPTCTSATAPLPLLYSSSFMHLCLIMPPKIELLNVIYPSIIYKYKVYNVFRAST